MGRTFRFNKKDGRRRGKSESKSSRNKRKRDLSRGLKERDYDVSEDRFERFSSHGKPRKP